MVEVLVEELGFDMEDAQEFVAEREAEWAEMNELERDWYDNDIEEFVFRMAHSEMYPDD